ncbi:hypothetical protein RHSIM_Rhsim10G0184700 [Rhododendron simsii]|uniref:CCHC-type domain-containing protein n=1 Tax=Rhododendron simsii TaxID=118357 RepID=A0A834GCV9_RHOSS|nr:hypothetical protein RHSIM_Rhsim10G0184700 [Rhododendron simsii]
MRESHRLDTDLNLMSDLAGSRRSISVRRSTLLAIISAEGGGDSVFVSVLQKNFYCTTKVGKIQHISSDPAYDDRHHKKGRSDQLISHPDGYAQSVLVAAQRPHFRPQKTIGGNHKVGIDECNFCHEKGHWKKDCPKLRNKGKGILPSPHQTSQYNHNAFKPLSSGPISAFSSHSAAASSDRTFNRTAITHEEIQSLVAQQIQQLLGTSLESQNSAAMSVMNTEDASPSSTLLQNETPSQSDPPAISDDVDPTTSQVEIRVGMAFDDGGRARLKNPENFEWPTVEECNHTLDEMHLFDMSDPLYEVARHIFRESKEHREQWMFLRQHQAMVIKNWIELNGQKLGVHKC